MSFLATLALAIAVFAAVPIAAHLLRRSRADEQEFPPARLVPSAQPVARQRRRLEDRALLGIRALLIIALAVLGATPLVRCSRLSLSRDAGASVALALVVDDSMSMRAKTASGAPRFERAIDGARELLSGTREGDAVAIILAGSPARLALSATTDLSEARRTLGELRVSDRPTDLAAAVQMARSSLKPLPHRDHRVVLLSDLAGDKLPDGDPGVWAPLEALQEPLHDCGIISAARSGGRVLVQVACSSSHAAKGRKLEIVAGEQKPVDGGKRQPAEAGDVLGSADVATQVGTQALTVELDAASVTLDARLTGSDAIVDDNQAPVVPEGTALAVGLVVDSATMTVTTGGPTIIEQAFAALQSDAQVKPMAVVPDQQRQLERIAALVLDDPPGIPAETRRALSAWLRRGGVALAFLGPRAETAQLGSTLEPFVHGAVHWEKTKSKGAAAATLTWLGNAGASLTDLAPQGRAQLAGVEPPGAKVVGRWNDKQPLLVEAPVGRGLVIVAGLPIDVEQSDFALRPGFLALLSHLVEQAAQRTGPRISLAGRAWSFSSDSSVRIRGPGGPVELTDAPGRSELSALRIATPTRLGRYLVSVDDTAQERIVQISEQEVLQQSRPLKELTRSVRSGNVASQVDASREIAIVLLVLFVFELLLRLLRRWRAVTQRRRA